jgi:3-hydroxybutyryl-CoA dehydratase
MALLKREQMQPGGALPSVICTITQELIDRYAGVSRDRNPIHIDPAFARQTPLGGTVAHGMLVLALISRMMSQAFGVTWYGAGGLNVRFKAPARPGDTLTARGILVRRDARDTGDVVVCEVACHNQNGDLVITGEATVRLTNDNIG